MSQKTWTEEQEQDLIRMYRADDEKDVHALAKHFGKGYRSVISKLVQLRVYIKPEINKDDKGMTVKVMLRELETTLKIEIEGTNLNKKENLTKVVLALRETLKNGR